MITLMLLFSASHSNGQTLQNSFIWSPSLDTSTQVYRAFRKSFTLASNPPSATLNLFADSRYILWVNGKYVLRGPCRFDWHRPEYDSVNVQPYLQAGTNVIAVLVHSYRGGGNSKIMDHVPGLSAQLQLPGTNLFTDATWRSGPTSYQPSPGAWGSIPDVIDARVQTNDWTATNFVDSAWETAAFIDGMQWGAIQPREIPLATETVLTNVTVLPSNQTLASTLPLTLNAGDSVLLNINQMSLAWAELNLSATSGSVLQMTYYLRYVNGSPSETYGVGTTYTARAGQQSFITGDEWGFHYVKLQCTSGSITLNGIKFVDRRYPFTRVGQFTCNESVLNQLWSNSVNTIELASDDGYGVDPRERNEWLQDPAQPNFITTRVANSAPNTNGAPLFSDPRLLKNLMRHTSYTSYQSGDGRLKAHTCSDRWDVHGYIEDYACQWVESLKIYYDATGDTNFVAEMWPTLTNQMTWFLNSRTTNGLVYAREYTSFDNALAYIYCEGATLNAFVYQALKDSAYLGNAIGQTAQAASYLSSATNLATAFDQKLWNAGSGTYNSALLNNSALAPTTHAALIALDRGIVPTNKIASVQNWFLMNYRNAGTVNVGGNGNYLTWVNQTVGINMPVSYYWVFNLLYGMDSPARDLEALSEIRRRWSDMVTNRLDTGTVTEFFTDVNGGAESCHNYGAVPAWFLSSYVLGVRLQGPVWMNRLLIEPRLGDLQFASGIVTTEHGPVPVAWNQAGNSGQLLNFSFTVPTNKSATVRLPKTSATNTLILNGVTLVNNGVLSGGVSTNGRWFVLDLPAGTNAGTLTLTLSPPNILSQPAGGMAFTGEAFTFSVSASGANLGYQWLKNSTNLINATNATLTLTNVALKDAGNYQVVVSNSGGGTNSAIAALQVVGSVTNVLYLDRFSGASDALNNRTPDTTTTGGNKWTAASGWITDGARVNVTNASINAFLPFTPVAGHVYRLSADINCIGNSGNDWLSLGFANGTTTGTAWHLANNPVGWMLARNSSTATSDGQVFIGPGTSESGTTGIYPTNVMNYAIILDTRPASASAWTFKFLVNSNVVVPATAFGGSGPTISSIGIGMLAGGGYGHVDNFTLTDASSAAPIITGQPQGATIGAGNTATLGVSVSGSSPLYYQWLKNSAAILNATNSTLSITNFSATNAGNYNVVITNFAGSAVSSNAVLTLGPSILVISSAFNSGNVSPSIACLSNDLIQTSLASVSPAASGNNFTGLNMRNGSTGAANANTTADPANIMDAGTYDFVLNTNSAPDGYDIASIVTYSGWTDFRAGQDHSLWYQTVANSSFVQITNISFAATAGSLRVAVNQSSGAIASGVRTIRVVVNQSTFVYREIDVIGTATVVPVPTLQIALAGNNAVRLWWDAASTGFTLKSTTNLAVSASWQTVNTTPVLTNGVFQVTLPITNSLFLRLQK